jgi:hypothetical protein
MWYILKIAIKIVDPKLFYFGFGYTLWFTDKKQQP